MRKLSLERFDDLPKITSLHPNGPNFQNLYSSPLNSTKWKRLGWGWKDQDT